MYSSCVVEALDVCVDLLSGFGTCLEMCPVYGFFLEIYKEAFTPTDISRGTDSREDLPESFFAQKIHHLFGCIFAATVIVVAPGDLVQSNHFLDRLTHQIGFRVSGYVLRHSLRHWSDTGNQILLSFLM